MTVVRGVIKEIGGHRTVRVSARRWYGVTSFVVQDEESGQTYRVNLSAKVMEKCMFLPRVGMRVIIHGFVEEADYGLTDFVVSRVEHIRHDIGEGGARRVVRFDE